jgi:hypothetical protein
MLDMMVFFLFEVYSWLTLIILECLPLSRIQPGGRLRHTRDIYDYGYIYIINRFMTSFFLLQKYTSALLPTLSRVILPVPFLFLLAPSGPDLPLAPGLIHTSKATSLLSQRLVVLLLACAAVPSRAGSCAAADPNDAVADDDALTACLAASPLLLLDPPSSPGGAGYLLNSSGIVVSLNGSAIKTSSSTNDALAVITAGAGLVWPMVYSNSTIVGLTLYGLRIDGNRAARNATMQTLCSADAGARNDNYRTSNVLLPGFRWADAPTWRCWDPWSRFVANVSIRNCEILGSPCGAGVGISGRDFVIADNSVLSNGGDALHNAQRVAFPYADGLNLAVCANGTVERNIIQDATNMMIAVGPGPGCLVRNNILVQRATISQNGINVWPTNVGEAQPWWHPEPWNFAHSAIVGNSISVVRSPDGDVGLLSGIAIGGLAWAAYATEPDAGLVAANVIDGANVGLFVDGVCGGAVYGNEILSVFGSSSWASNCATPHAYTAADVKGTLLQSGFERIAFRQGPCEEDAEQPPVASTIDDAAFVSQTVNGLSNPVSLTIACGAEIALSLTFANSGSSAWQDMPAGLGVLAGAAPRAEPYYFSGTLRAPIGVMVEVAPGDAVVVNVSMSAPLTAGTYALQWQMVREPLAVFFGTPSIAVEVIVQCSGLTPAQQLQAVVDEAIAAGMPSVVAAAGVFSFGARNLEVNSAADFTLLAPSTGASTLVFAPGYGMLVQGCVRTTIAGFVIDYDPPCFTQGEIVNVTGSAGTPGSIDVHLDEGFPLPSAVWFASSETKLQFYADDAQRRRDPAQRAFQPVVAPPTEAAPGVWRFPALWQANYMPHAGQLATISPRANTSGFVIPDYYSGNALTVLNSSAVVVVNVSVLGSGNFGVLEWGGDGGHIFRHLTIARPRAHLLSTNCDGFHSFSCGHGALVEDASVSFTGDDLANFHNREGLVLYNSTAAASGFLVVDVGDIPSPLGPSAAPLRVMDDLRPGDTLRIFAPGGAGALLATVVVGTVARSVDGVALEAARALIVALGFEGRVNPAAVALFNVSGTAAGGTVLLAGSVVQFDRRASAGGALIRVTAEDLYDSCGRLQASGVTMLNSTCRRAYSGLTVVYDAAFLEGTRAIVGVAVDGNTFAAVGNPPAEDMQGVLVRDADAVVEESGNVVREK